MDKQDVSYIVFHVLFQRSVNSIVSGILQNQTAFLNILEEMQRNFDEQSFTKRTMEKHIRQCLISIHIVCMIV